MRVDCDNTAIYTRSVILHVCIYIDCSVYCSRMFDLFSVAQTVGDRECLWRARVSSSLSHKSHTYIYIYTYVIARCAFVIRYIATDKSLVWCICLARIYRYLLLALCGARLYLCGAFRAERKISIDGIMGRESFGARGFDTLSISTLTI